MIFQTLDDKSECVGIYTDKRLYFDEKDFPKNLSATWKHSSHLRDKDIEYASLYLEGKPFEECVPEYLLDDWEDASTKLQSFHRSLTTAKVDISENCFFDLVPKRFLIEFCETKNKITEHVLKCLPRPKRYEFYKQVSIMLADIENRKVCIDKQKIRSYVGHSKLDSRAKAILSAPPYVKYNQFGTKTGRLTTKRNTFPILTMNKEFRAAVKPQNDYFLELDFNGAEIRVLLGLLGKDQPRNDVHTYHSESLFNNMHTREKVKTLFFAWLYGSKTAIDNSLSEKLSNFYQKEKIVNNYWDGKNVTSYYKKIIPCTSKHHALNYLVQSTAAELALKQFLKINYALQKMGSGSSVSFLVHDAIVLDMKKQDEKLINVLVKLMSSTNFGDFLVNIKRGDSLGSLKECSFV